MARGFDRRAVLRGGCAMWAVGCAGPTATTPTDDRPDDTGTTPPGHSAATTDTEPSIDGYPCDQAIDGAAAGWTELPLSEYPDLAEVGGWYGVTVGGRELVVAHVVEGCYTAMDRACAHEGRFIDYRPERLQFVCPLHGAIYAPDGTKVAGPQPTGLPVHPCGRVGDVILVKTT